MIKRFCDICGKEFTDWYDVERYKVKKETYSFHESWWDRLDVHRECWLQVCKSIKNGFEPVTGKAKEN